MEKAHETRKRIGWSARHARSRTRWTRDAHADDADDLWHRVVGHALTAREHGARHNHVLYFQGATASNEGRMWGSNRSPPPEDVEHGLLLRVVEYPLRPRMFLRAEGLLILSKTLKKSTH